MEYEKITSYTEIEGWCDYDDIYACIASLIPEGGKFVEVGVWMGRSICAFASWIRALDKKVEIYAIDTFRGSEEWEQSRPELVDKIRDHGGSMLNHFIFNIQSLGFKDEIIPIVEDSSDAAKQFEDESVFAVFIDASTIHEAYLRNIEAWYPKIKKGGLICGHNWHNNNVCQAVKDFFIPRGVSIIRVSSSGWMARKDERN